jgi:multidrug resistance efflux pump
VKILLLAAVAAPILFLGKMELKVRGAFDVLPIHNADVRAEVEGIVEEICVDEGDVVRAGDVIARLSDRAVRAELRKTEAEIAQIRARLRMLEAGPTAEEVAVARATVAKMEDRLSYARNALTRDKALFEQKLLSRMDFEATEEQVASAENELNEARGRLQVLLRGTRPEEIDGTKAEIARLETQRRFLEEQMELSKVASPITGIVATPSLQLREMKHQLVTKGALIAKVYDCKTVTAQIVVSEKDIADVQAGRRVLLKARAYPDQLFQGTVTAIATTAQLNPASTSSASTGAPPQSRGSGTPKMVRVTTEIENPSFLLKPEMTGQAKILCGQRRIFDLLTRRLARTLKVEFWSWW